MTVGVKQKVSISNDCTTPLGIMPHNYVKLPPPPPNPPIIAAHVDLPATIWWPPGDGMGQNKLTSTVKHKGLCMAQEDHDCGTLILHWPLAPPLNVLLALIIPFSSRKMVFSASTVKADGKSIATSDLIHGSTPMLTCADPISLPLSFPVTNALNTVHAGVTAADLAVGLVTIAGSMLADFLASKAGGKGGGGFSFGSAFAGKLLGGGSGEEIFIKAVVGVLTDGFKVAIRGEGSIDLMNVGSPFGNFKATVNVGSDGKLIASWKLSVASPTGAAERGENATIKPGRPRGGAAAAAEAAKNDLVGGVEPL